MNVIRLNADYYGNLSSTSRDQLLSFLKNNGGFLGEQLAAVALPQVEAELKSRAAALRQGEVELAGISQGKWPTHHATPRLVSFTDYSPETCGVKFPRKIV